MIQQADRKQLLIWHPDAVNSLNPRTGDVYWSVPLKPDYAMSITAPRKLGDYLFASGIGNAGRLDEARTCKTRRGGGMAGQDKNGRLLRY